MKMFGSDNNSGIHPAVIDAIIAENDRGHAVPYGEDETTKRAGELIEKLMGKKANVHFTTTGTSANIIGLSGLLRPYEAVVTINSAHIRVDECNALERFNGSTILDVEGRQGKIYPEHVKPLLTAHGDHHASQPKVISISQVTEIGTMYTVEEIKNLADFAHKHDMYLHVDGARIANALEALESTFKEMIGDTGVDLFSFGGTKNGMMIGEAIVSFVMDKKKDHIYSVKQGMQLLSKMRFVSSQFIGYLEDDLYMKNAKQANDMGRYLCEELNKIDGVSVVDYQNNNMLFVKMRDEEMIRGLASKLYFYVIDEEENIIRLITSYDTTKADVEKIVNTVKSL